MVFVDDTAAPELLPEDRHHLGRVLRVRPGGPITVADGQGRWRPARFGHRIEVDGPVQVAPPEHPAVTVAFALIKGDRPELVVQKLTELGVDRIVAFGAARSVVRWDAERARRHLDRLRRVAREAAMQARRARLPQVDMLAGFTAAAALPGAAMAELDGGPPSLAYPTVLVGPEGGWDDEERAAPIPKVSLGEHVLRSETAAVAAGVMLGSLRRAATGGPPARTDGPVW